MSRAQQKPTPTDEHAKRIARAFAKGRPPPLNTELDRYCESAPREIFAAFAGVARHMPPAGNDQDLAVGYLVVLQRLLETLRYRVDAGHADAAELIADFRADIVEQVKAGRVAGALLGFVGDVLHQAKIPASPELAIAVAEQPVELDSDEATPTDIRTAFADILELCSADSFMAVGTLMQSGHAMPVETRSVLAGTLAVADNAAARGAAVLFLLDQASSVRRDTADMLAEVAASLSPTDIRRLIAMRNWRPEGERAGIDAIIRKARAAGIECARWEDGNVKSLIATAIDGASAQGFLLVSPDGSKGRLSSVLTKGGIADAWSGDPETRRRIERQVADARRNAPMLEVSRSYFDRIVSHHLALGAENGHTPPIGLLQVAETIGGADWQPSLMAFEQMLAALIAEVPKSMRQPAAVASILRRSDELVDLEVVAQSWFEIGPEIARAVENAPGANREALATYLLQTVFAKYRHKWAETILRTAQWMHETPSAADLCWRDLVIVAKALADGRDLTDIGLMRDIAIRTVTVLRDTRSL